MENRILDAIRTLAASGETGSLQLQSGATQGDLFFRHGEVVDARVGNLTGFTAVNAIAAMRDAAFSFDPSVAPPPLSSIRPSERVVLKQFFGIHPVRREEELTVELPRVAAPRRSRSKFAYRFAAVFAVLLVLIAATAVALRNRYREQAAPTAVLSTEESASTPATATLATNKESASTPVAPAPATVATSKEPVSNPVASAPAAVATSKEPVSADAPAPAVDQHDLTGKWTVVNTIQNTSYGSYKNLQIGFDLSIKQDGNGFTGEGRKVSENGRPLPANSRTPIHVKGSIEGDRIEAQFFEDGGQRQTNGRFVWKFDKAGGLNGTFRSNAARASGKSTARKEL